MSRHFLLDGYNLIHKRPELVQKKLEDARNGLVRLIQTQNPHGSSRNKVTIVFDGQPDVFGGGPSSDIRIIFTEHETADDRIKRMVEESPRRTNIVVVSDDKGITHYVRAMGAAVMGVAEFLSQGEDVRARKARESRPDPSKESLPPSAQQAIDDELRDIWLKDQ